MKYTKDIMLCLRIPWTTRASRLWRKGYSLKQTREKRSLYLNNGGQEEADQENVRGNRKQGRLFKKSFDRRIAVGKIKLRGNKANNQRRDNGKIGVLNHSPFSATFIKQV